MSQTLKYARERRGWTLEQLALRCGMNARSLRRLELNQATPHFSTVVALEKALKLKRGQLRFASPSERQPRPDRQPVAPEGPGPEVAGEPLLPADLSPTDEGPVTGQDAPDLG